MTYSQAAAALSGKAALPDTWDLTARVPSWIVSDYRACYGWLLDACCFAGIFLDGRSKLMIERHGLCHSMETGAWDRR